MELYSKKDLNVFTEKIDDVINNVKVIHHNIYEPTGEEKKKNMKYIIDYIKEHNRKIYGGYAINILLKAKDKEAAIYCPIDEVDADIDFYSPYPHDDLIKLCNILDDAGAKDVQGSEAEHEDTYTIFVNQHKYCDITYVPNNIYHRINYNEMNGLYVTHPHFITIDYLRIFTNPIGSYLQRLDKSFCRVNKLLEYYPLLNINKRINLIDKRSDDDVLKTVFTFIKDTPTTILFGYYAYNYYLYKSGIYDRNMNYLNIPYYEILTDEYEKDGCKLISLLRKTYSKDDIKIIEFYPFFQFYGNNCIIYYKDIPVVHIFKNIGICYPIKNIKPLKFKNNKVTEDTGKINIGSYSFVLMFSMMFTIRNRVLKDKQRMEIFQIMTSHLIKMKNYYFKHNNKTFMDDTPFQDFIVDCIGNYLDGRRLYRDKLTARKKDKNWKGPLNFKYFPANKRLTEKTSFVFPNTSGNQIINLKNLVLMNSKDYIQSSTLSESLSMDVTDVTDVTDDTTNT